MSFHNITELDETASVPAHQITQSSKSTPDPIIFPGSAIVRSAPSSSKRRKLSDILKRANSAVDMRTIADHLYEALWGEEINAQKLRIMYGVPEGESLRRALADQSPLLYSALKDAEVRLGIFVEGMMESGVALHLGAIYYAAGNVGRANRYYANRFHDRMKELIPKVEYDELANTFNPVEGD